MIQELEIRGFRSFRQAVWRPGRLNLLVGVNGAGKSNLLRLLEMLCDTAKGNLQKLVSESGGMVPLIWDHQVGKLGCRVRIDPVDEGRDQTKDALTFEIELEQVRGGSAYEITKDAFGNWYKYERQLERSPYWIFHRDRIRAMVYDQEVGGLVNLDDEDESDRDAYDHNESLLSQIAGPRNKIPLLAKRLIGSWRIHHDVHAERGSPMRLPATTQHTTLVDPDGSNLATVLHTLYTGEREFKNAIDDGMKAGFGDEYEGLVFQPAAAQQIQIAIQWKSSSKPHAGQDLSDGTLRFLFLLTVLASPIPSPLIAIDEPEVGLHPTMLPIVAEYAASAAERTQVVITTHSPEFLDAFSNLSPHVTVCHWEAGQSELFTLDSNTLNKWLQEYRLGHLFTHGELEAMTLEPVDSFDDSSLDLPPEEDVLTEP